MSPTSGDLFEFGPFVLDPAKHQLLRDGEAVPLTPKTFDLLRVLVENHDRMLSKEELIKTLWPDSYVDQSNLTQQISMIRRALGESAGESRFVTTVPARGYRFTAAVTRRSGCQSEAGPAPAGALDPPHGKKIRPRQVWPWIAAAGLLLASGAVVISIHGIRPS